jgi:hypothetical protein
MQQKLERTTLACVPESYLNLNPQINHQNALRKI